MSREMWGDETERIVEGVGIQQSSDNTEPAHTSLETKAGADAGHADVHSHEQIKQEPADQERDNDEVTQPGHNTDRAVEEMAQSIYSECEVKEEVIRELYPDHVFKEEIVIGPEMLQRTVLPAQENIFSSWLEEKVDLPIVENIPQGPERVEALAPAVPYITPQPTEKLLREFETAYGAVELTHLTPPQSPLRPATQLLLSYAQQARCAPLAPSLAPHEQWSVAPAPVVQLALYEIDLQAVEELVRYRAAELASPLTSGDSSLRSSPPSSPRSSTDEDWSVPSRPKPYSRFTDDPRTHKKEQNKNAAKRYRQKKKAVIEVLLNEEHSLRQRHNELGYKCFDLQREIRYLIGLLRNLFKAKGLIK